MTVSPQQQQRKQQKQQVRRNFRPRQSSRNRGHPPSTCELSSRAHSAKVEWERKYGEPCPYARPAAERTCLFVGCDVSIMPGIAHEEEYERREDDSTFLSSRRRLLSAAGEQFCKFGSGLSKALHNSEWREYSFNFDRPGEAEHTTPVAAANKKAKLMRATSRTTSSIRGTHDQIFASTRKRRRNPTLLEVHERVISAALRELNLPRGKPFENLGERLGGGHDDLTYCDRGNILPDASSLAGYYQRSTESCGPAACKREPSAFARNQPRQSQGCRRYRPRTADAPQTLFLPRFKAQASSTSPLLRSAASNTRSRGVRSDNLFSYTVENHLSHGEKKDDLTEKPRDQNQAILSLVLRPNSGTSRGADRGIKKRRRPPKASSRQGKGQRNESSSKSPVKVVSAETASCAKNEELPWRHELVSRLPSPEASCDAGRESRASSPVLEERVSHSFPAETDAARKCKTTLGPVGNTISAGDSTAHTKDPGDHAKFGTPSPTITDESKPESRSLNNQHGDITGIATNRVPFSPSVVPPCKTNAGVSREVAEVYANQVISQCLRTWLTAVSGGVAQMSAAPCTTVELLAGASAAGSTSKEGVQKCNAVCLVSASSPGGVENSRRKMSAEPDLLAEGEQVANGYTGSVSPASDMAALTCVGNGTQMNVARQCVAECLRKGSLAFLGASYISNQVQSPPSPEAGETVAAEEVVAAQCADEVLRRGSQAYLATISTGDAMRGAPSEATAMPTPQSSEAVKQRIGGVIRKSSHTHIATHFCPENMRVEAGITAVGATEIGVVDGRYIGKRSPVESQAHISKNPLELDCRVDGPNAVVPRVTEPSVPTEQDQIALKGNQESITGTEDKCQAEATDARSLAEQFVENAFRNGSQTYLAAELHRKNHTSITTRLPDFGKEISYSGGRGDEASLASSDSSAIDFILKDDDVDDDDGGNLSVDVGKEAEATCCPAEDGQEDEEAVLHDLADPSTLLAPNGLSGHSSDTTRPTHPLRSDMRALPPGFLDALNAGRGTLKPGLSPHQARTVGQEESEARLKEGEDVDSEEEDRVGILRELETLLRVKGLDLYPPNNYRRGIIYGEGKHSVVYRAEENVDKHSSGDDDDGNEGSRWDHGNEGQKVPTTMTPRALSRPPFVFAAKEFRYRRSRVPLSILRDARREINMYLRASECNRVVELRGVWLAPRVTLLLEPINGGSFHDFVRDGRGLKRTQGQEAAGVDREMEGSIAGDEENTRFRTQVAWLLAEVADGIAALHDAGIVHRDVKSHNVFVVCRSRRVPRDAGHIACGCEYQRNTNSNHDDALSNTVMKECPSCGALEWAAKLGDLGSAGMIPLEGEARLTEETGTSGWVAPEVRCFRLTCTL